MPRAKPSQLVDEAMGLIAAAAERRRFRRFARPGWINIFPCSTRGAGAAVRVRFRDICVRGIGITHSAAMDIGDQFLLGLLQDEEKLAVVLFKVANCTGPILEPQAPEQEPAVYHIGAEPAWVLRDQKITPGNKLSTSALTRINRMIELEAGKC